MRAGTIKTRCLACGSPVGFAVYGGKVEFECVGRDRHVYTVPAANVDEGSPALLIDELYRRTAQRGLGLSGDDDGGERIGRLCPVCGAAMTVERSARRGVFRCTGAIVHSWEIEGADMHRAPAERCFDLVAELAPFASGRRVS